MYICYHFFPYLWSQIFVRRFKLFAFVAVFYKIFNLYSHIWTIVELSKSEGGAFATPPCAAVFGSCVFAISIDVKTSGTHNFHLISLISGSLCSNFIFLNMMLFSTRRLGKLSWFWFIVSVNFNYPGYSNSVTSISNQFSSSAATICSKPFRCSIWKSIVCSCSDHLESLPLKSFKDMTHLDLRDQWSL